MATIAIQWGAWAAGKPLPTRRQFKLHILLLCSGPQGHAFNSFEAFVM